MKILGQILAIGNVLNGGTAKGQADGFDLPVFTKLTAMKDATGKSLLEYIMLKLKEADPDADIMIKQLITKTVFKDCDNEYIKNKARELQAMFGNAKASFDQITSLNDPYKSTFPGDDTFVGLMSEFLDQTKKECD